MSIRRHMPVLTSPRSRDYAHRRRHVYHGDRVAARLARYGISQDAYDQRLAAQDGKCAICQQLPGRKGLVIDHDHASGEFRELLCGRCNIVLGLVRDDAQICRALAQYLDDWQPVVKGDTMASTVSGSATP